jgi:TRAP transporter TAXI family solute receptor
VAGIRLLTVLATLIVITAGCGADPPRSRLLIATGQPGGVYFVYGTGLAQMAERHLPAVRPEVLITEASLDNLRLVAAGRADVAFTLADSAALAIGGAAPFDRPQPLRALARLYDNYLYLVVRADSAITSLAGLRGTVISTSAASSGTDLIAERLLGVAGLAPGRSLTVRKLDLGDSVAALRERRIDAFFFSGGLPTQAITALADQRLIRLIDLKAYVAPMQERYGEFYSERTVPRSAYGLPDTVTIGVPNYLVVREDMKESLAYALTRLLFTQRDGLASAHPEARYLNVREALSTYPVALHPGAARYYRSTRS